MKKTIEYFRVNGLWLDHKKKEAAMFGDPISYKKASVLYRDWNKSANLIEGIFVDKRITLKEYMALTEFEHKAIQSHLKSLIN